MGQKAEIGDNVWIYDHKSGLFIFEGEVIDIKGRQALIMVPCGLEAKYGCVADIFDVEKLEVRKKKKI